MNNKINKKELKIFKKTAVHHLLFNDYTKKD